MAPPLSRFPTGGPYHQQFPAANQQHQPSHGPPMGSSTTPAVPFIGPGVNAFAPNGGGMLGLGGGAGAIGASAFAGVVSDTGLGGHAARMGFAQAGNTHHSQHQHQPSHSSMGEHPVRATTNKGRIREVWRHNLNEEFATIRAVVEQNYSYIAMDTEFPGIVARPMGMFRGKSDYHYQCLRVNVDLLNIIQIGITVFNENGETPPARPHSIDSTEVTGGRRSAGQPPIPYTWQFNFKFNLKEDMFNTSSIDSLTQAGIDFNLLERDGIDPHDFAALLIPSGLVCEEDVKWISFHGGYDFGYLMKLLLCDQLPNDEAEFEHYRKIYFPSVYDVKYLMKSAIRQNAAGMLQSPNGAGPDSAITEILAKYEQKQGLENIAEVLKVKRVGTAHQAGSDSLVTGKVFFQLRDRVFGGEISSDHVGRIWGLGVPDILNPAGWNLGGQGGGVTLDANSQDGGQMQQSNGGNGNSTATGTTNGAPSTPNTASADLASSTTPIPQGHGPNGLAGATGLGSLTPGGGTGVFGGFNIGGGSNNTTR
ncbi:CAF1 family ribonuclease [Zalerion maritima]|uniref:poly(A)-specific ribonuclease n=1 Tax=Zalerion maritima TaxID=339359 RepID=A0AAD5S0V6_9PEZI|nr:CAF1 family ribonuclease [Zalerion maritima]